MSKRLINEVDKLEAITEDEIEISDDEMSEDIRDTISEDEIEICEIKWGEPIDNGVAWDYDYTEK